MDSTENPETRSGSDEPERRDPAAQIRDEEESNARQTTGNLRDVERDQELHRDAEDLTVATQGSEGPDVLDNTTMSPGDSDSPQSTKDAERSKTEDDTSSMA